MITRIEKEKMQRKFNENKLKKKKPTNICQLAPILGVTRQALYYCINGNIKSSPTLKKLKDWITEEIANIEYKQITRVFDYKVDLLKNYGFKKVDDVWETSIYEKNNVKCKLIVDQNLILNINFITEDNDNELIDEILVLIFKLSKDRIIKIDSEIK